MKYFQFILIITLALVCSGAKVIPKSKSTIITNHKEIIKDSVFIVNSNNALAIIKTDILKNNGSKTEKQDTTFHQTTLLTDTSIHQLWNELLQNHVSVNGNVDYKAFKDDHKKLLDYIHILNITNQNEGFHTFSREEKLAYWINAYNALTIDLILRYYPIKSIKSIKDPWEQRLWKLGSKWYNLNDIEHEILRKMEEPRIHFAIVCASVSCPNLSNEAYSPENIEVQLTKATQIFLRDTNKNTISKDQLELSKIFQWFTKDFKQNGTLIEFLNQYSEIQISTSAKINFKEYNWDLND
ncbi:DUF547 domain-containing protein [Mariniflexile sp.]|uniref:DUF547 domain-containing protein n=1 Tax=Mariniflexile sp. TaxID=1979402 RepID=UPI0035658018